MAWFRDSQDMDSENNTASHAVQNLGMIAHVGGECRYQVRALYQLSGSALQPRGGCNKRACTEGK